MNYKGVCSTASATQGLLNIPPEIVIYPNVLPDYIFNQKFPRPISNHAKTNSILVGISFLLIQCQKWDIGMCGAPTHQRGHMVMEVQAMEREGVGQQGQGHQ